MGHQLVDEQLDSAIIRLLADQGAEIEAAGISPARAAASVRLGFRASAGIGRPARRTRFQPMNVTLRVAAVGALALAVGIGVVQLRPSNDGVGAEVSPSASPSSVPTPAADEPSREPVASPIAETIHGWPGTRRAPAGLYSWDVAPTAGFSRRNWMHKIPMGYAGGCCAEVDLTFYAGAPLAERETKSDGAQSGWGVEGPFDRPFRVESTETWIIEVEGTRVAIVLDSYAYTDPALVDEARAVIESIVVEPTETGHRLVFRLEEGWDSG